MLLLFICSRNLSVISFLSLVSVGVLVHECLHAFRPKDEELSAVEHLLDGEEGLGEEGEKVGGVIIRKRKGDTAVRKLAQKLTKDVEQLKKEKEEYSM